MLSIILPTYNEKENILELVERIFKVFAENEIEGEVVVVDDDSPDGTANVAEGLRSKYNVKVIVRKNERGLASAAIRGMEVAKGDILCVMDADLSHPTEQIPKMLTQIEKGDAELVVASRHVKGGGIENQTTKQKVVSKLASLITRPLTKVKDPMSGFFMLRRDVLEGVELKPKCHRLGLEIIVKGNYKHLIEVPYVLKNRAHGESKLGTKAGRDHLSHALRLYFYKDSSFYQFLKYCVVGGLGVFVDLAVFSLVYWGYFLSFGQSTGTIYAQTISFSIAVTFNFTLNKIWTFQDKERRKVKVSQQYIKFIAVNVSAWAIRTFIIYFILNYQSVWRFYSMPIATWFISVLSIERFALLIAIIIAVFWNFFGSKHFVFKRERKLIKPTSD